MTTAEKHVQQEQQEVFLVVVPDTVVNPRAVVVHSCDAATAN